MIALRRVLRPVHRWVGLSVGLVVMWMALTGSMLLWRKQLEVPLDRDLLSVATCAQRVPLDALAANALQAYPKGKFDYIRLIAGEPGETRMPAAMVRFTDQMFVYLNPCTGEVLGQRGRYRGPFGMLEQLHRLRFVPNGGLVVGSSAIMFGLVLVIGGLVL
ncbi:PepSY-associated TM helix domain-containing protein, partial [Rudaea sp.]|uniref:PepSY-associated TM helix domain-containing protein n=1 Tax=Rudaea sp. TaxID=2136325 RepID=UPI002ED26122